MFLLVSCAFSKKLNKNSLALESYATLRLNLYLLKYFKFSSKHEI